MISDSSFERPEGWAGAGFSAMTPGGTELDRPRPGGLEVLRCLERRDERLLGVWEGATGRLRCLLERAADARWTNDGAALVTVTEEVMVRILEWPALKVLNSARLDFDTRRGVAGLDLVLSAAGDMGIVRLWSGQSEEGLAIFSLPDLRTVACLAYVVGESASLPVFSPDGRYVVHVLEPFAIWWIGDGEVATDEEPAVGGRVQWATIHVHDLRQPVRHDEYPVFVEVPKGWLPSEDVRGASWPRAVRFTEVGRLAFDVPWGGTCVTPVPPLGSCDAPPPRKR
ncbi:MAG: hypothetical protein QM704_15380 [Anaeromyxobacteraceae bacterium]